MQISTVITNPMGQQSRIESQVHAPCSAQYTQTDPVRVSPIDNPFVPYSNPGRQPAGIQAHAVFPFTASYAPANHFAGYLPNPALNLIAFPSSSFPKVLDSQLTRYVLLRNLMFGHSSFPMAPNSTFAQTATC